MPTLPERVATLEAELDALRREHGRLEAQMNGGPGVEYRDSVRGRLHSMKSALAAADKMLEAAQAAARAQREAAHTVEAARGRMLNRWTQAVLVLCAVATAVAAWVALALHAQG